ncbi:hypothetical protein ACJX0J_006589, partial [Zea mays]
EHLPMCLDVHVLVDINHEELTFFQFSSDLNFSQLNYVFSLDLVIIDAMGEIRIEEKSYHMFGDLGMKHVYVFRAKGIIMYLKLNLNIEIILSELEIEGIKRVLNSTCLAPFYFSPFNPLYSISLAKP